MRALGPLDTLADNVAKPDGAITYCKTSERERGAPKFPQKDHFPAFFFLFLTILAPATTEIRRIFSLQAQVQIFLARGSERRSSSIVALR